MNEIIEKNESSDLDSEEDYDESAIVAIITLWDDEIGPKIVDAYPKTNLKLDKISLQIFMMYQLFLDDPNKPFQDTSMTIPLKLIDRKCRFQFNSFPNENIRGGFQPFTISLIFPDYYSNKQIEQFNEIILKISQEFKRDQSIKLESFYDNIKNLIKFELIEAEKEDIIIDDNYSYTAAIEDFQAGVNLYRTKNYEKALEKIKKVLLKFRMEKNDHLVMEALNLIASIFSQQKFFNKASKYFKELVELAESLQQEKYLEIGTFMLAYCYYKVEDYRRSFEIFKKIDVNNIKYINKLQFFTIYGRVCEKLGDYNNAIEFLLEANDIGETLQKNKLTLSQLSLILYDIGFIYFKKAGRIIKDFGINNIKRYEKDLNNSLNYFKLSSKYLMQLNDKAQLSIIYQNIGNIYDILENEKEFIKYYKNALEILAEQKTLTQNVTILERMVQKNASLNYNLDNIKLLSENLPTLKTNRFIDLFTIAKLHTFYGEALLKESKYKEGLKEYEEALEIYQGFKIPVNEELKLLDKIIAYHERNQNLARIEYYKKKYKITREKLEEISLEQYQKARLGPLKEFWIFHTTSVCIFSYAPESEIQEDLLGGFLSAMQSFSQEVNQKKLNSLVIGNDRYTFFQEDDGDFYILGRSDEIIDENKIIGILRLIYTKFNKDFNEKIKKFNGDVQSFKNFKDTIKSIDISLL